MNETRPFNISKSSVKSAWNNVKANKGSYGIDNVSIKEFEKNKSDNLYKIWNRMSSGTYFPPPVKAVAIPKSNGKQRILGIPTVSDRVAQAVVKKHLEPIVEPKFHKDSYGFRPNKSALDAVEVCRERCWRYDWVIDLDIKGFFDNIDHELMMKAIKFHTKEKWIHLYVERWLVAPMQKEDGELISRDKGTPQGGVISPLLANIFLHHAFDEWIKRHYPYVEFERYADDVIIHCKTLEEAEKTLIAVEIRLNECGLELHPEKTKIVYCKRNRRNKNYKEIKFDFLGYTFRPRGVKNKNGEFFLSFLPAISDKASKNIRQIIRSWRIHRQNNRSIEELARKYNAIIRGWINYYGRFHKSAMYNSLRNIDKYLIRWLLKKYKRLKGSLRRALRLLGRIKKEEPNLFAHWKYV